MSQVTNSTSWKWSNRVPGWTPPLSPEEELFYEFSGVMIATMIFAILSCCSFVWCCCKEELQIWRNHRRSLQENTTGLTTPHQQEQEQRRQQRRDIHEHFQSLIQSLQRQNEPPPLYHEVENQQSNQGENPPEYHIAINMPKV